MPPTVVNDNRTTADFDCGAVPLSSNRRSPRRRRCAVRQSDQANIVATTATPSRADTGFTSSTANVLANRCRRERNNAGDGSNPISNHALSAAPVDGMVIWHFTIAFSLHTYRQIHQPPASSEFH